MLLSWSARWQLTLHKYELLCQQLQTPVLCLSQNYIGVSHILDGNTHHNVHTSLEISGKSWNFNTDVFVLETPYIINYPGNTWKISQKNPLDFSNHRKMLSVHDNFTPGASWKCPWCFFPVNCTNFVISDLDNFKVTYNHLGLWMTDLQTFTISLSKLTGWCISTISLVGFIINELDLLSRSQTVCFSTNWQMVHFNNTECRIAD